MTPIPVWLPPLPLAIIALTLFVFGTVTWLRADRLPPPRDRGDDHDAHGDGHDHAHDHAPGEHGHGHSHGGGAHHHH